MMKIKSILFAIKLMFISVNGYSQICDSVEEYFIQSKTDMVGELFIWNDMYNTTIQINLYSEDVNHGLTKTHLMIKGNTQFEFDEFTTTHYGGSQYTYTIPNGKNTSFILDGTITLKNGMTYKFVDFERGRTTLLYRISKPCLIK